MELRILNIFDFDGTLFRSPAPNPQIWDSSLIGKIKSAIDQSGLGWFQDVVTLSPPYVPEHPTDEWYVSDIKQQVLDSMNDPACVTVLLTGRSVKYLEIIKNLIAPAGLVFDEMGLKPGPEVTTMDFKVQFIATMVTKYQPFRLCLWEDRPQHAEKFRVTLKQRFPYIDSQVIMVDSAETYLPVEKEIEIIEVLTKNSGNAIHYKENVVFTGVMIDEESCSLLKAEFPPISGWTPYYHHMTICLGPLSSNKVLNLSSDVIGTEVTLQVVAVGRDRNAYAVEVKGFPSMNAKPHITLCVSPELSPKCSNDILDWKPIKKPFTIKGKIVEQIRYVAVKPPPKTKVTGKGKKLNIGKLIGELTGRKGKEIVDGVNTVLQWLQKNNIENSEDNLQIIKKFIYDNLL
jgi:hypothetical protein